MAAKVKLSIQKIEGQGVDIQRVVDGLRNLKAELQSPGCKVSVKVQGVELEAGNGTRTRDILLGKKSVMVEGKGDATLDYGACFFEHCDKWERIISPTRKFWCPVCQVVRSDADEREVAQ